MEVTRYSNSPNTGWPHQLQKPVLEPSIFLGPGVVLDDQVTNSLQSSQSHPNEMHQFKLKAMLYTKLRCTSSSPLLPHTFKPEKSNSSLSSSLDYTQWPGLQNWRDSPINNCRFWGSTGPESSIEVPNEGPMVLGSSLAEMGALVMSTADPLTKSKLSHWAYSRWRQEKLPIGSHEPPTRPARPPKPKLVSPKEIPAPKNSGLPLNAYMLHNLAHVELNAIDLAWDTVVRFSPFCELLGEGFFADFAQVADDESRHFAWCSQRLGELGFCYGDMPAHNLLWRECEKSSDNVAVRLAVIPLVQEARGLDAGPRLVQKLIGFGDCRSSNIVARIADEEVAHVAVGVSNFVSVCQKMGRAPCPTFRDLLKEYNVELKGPFNYSARDEAGIPRQCIDKTRGQVQCLKKKKRPSPALQVNSAGPLAHDITGSSSPTSSNPNPLRLSAAAPGPDSTGPARLFIDSVWFRPIFVRFRQIFDFRSVQPSCSPVLVASHLLRPV
ncbi:unnamed protein product [Ilex paraguariensis]|uniref:Uncharacterized protein n=1 Tax=Ilex paraguariensis TaxID=185542 RepID=A0ABC8UC21_9AQUA